MQIKTVADIREYIATHSILANPLADAWKEMLADMDLFDLRYTMDEFMQEAELVCGEHLDLYLGE